MKLSTPLIKLIIKLLILMMLFVLMFLISSFLYSARYWPDVYNYINANITIKRIPTISELELTVLDVDYTTEVSYSTTDVDYIDVSTVDDFDIDEFMKDEFDFNKKVKRNIVIEQLKDYIELPPRGIFVDYIFLEEPMRPETSTTSNIEDDETEVKASNYGTSVVFKTSVTGVVVDDDLPIGSKKMVSEEPALTKKYYTVIPPEKKEKRCVGDTTNLEEEPVTTESNTVEFIPEHSTTKEGYLVGEDPNLVDEETENPIVITTEANKNELVDEENDERFMKDLVDVSKLSTRGSDEVEMVTGKPEKLQIMADKRDPICHGNATCKEFTRSVYPWVATIFVTNDSSNNQFSYYCDGALISDKVIVTDARCLLASNKTWNVENVLVFLGKGNLQSFGDNEKVYKVKEIIIHPNFTTTEDGKVVNAVALLVMTEPVELNSNIQTACLHIDNNLQEAAATAWGLSGALIPIFFKRNKSEFCYDKDENIFCVSYGNDVALCPSYGGVLVTKQLDRWCLQGIFYGNPADRGICFTNDVYYTSVRNYLKWIDQTIGLYKNNNA